MKSQKLLVGTFTGCLLLGASTAAMAASDCELGVIANETRDGIHVNTGGNCLISDVLVLGDLVVKNGQDVLIRSTKVFGKIRIVDSKSVAVVDTEVVDGDLKVIRPETVYILDNRLVASGAVGAGKQILVKDVAAEGVILNNRVELGDINCKPLTNTFARGNVAVSIDCPGQL